MTNPIRRGGTLLAAATLTLGLAACGGGLSDSSSSSDSGSAGGDRPASLETVAGRGWITGNRQEVLDPSDPFPAGFVL